MWPELCALRLRRDRIWEEFRPVFRLIRPEIKPVSLGIRDNNNIRSKGITKLDSLSNIEDLKSKAFAGLRRQVPQSVATIVEPFTNHQWNLLDLISKEKAALELAENNPILAWCLANNDQFRKIYGNQTPAQRALPYVPKKQMEILDWLGFPASNGVVRLIRKIPPETIAPPDARMLRRAIKEPEVLRALAHLKVVNAGVLGFVNNLKLFVSVSPRLLAEVSEDEEEKVLQPTADRLVDALYIMTLGRLHIRIPVFDSIRAVRAFHDRVVSEWRKKIDEERNRKLEISRRERTLKAGPKSRPRPRPRPRPGPKTGKFPPPPVPGTPDILPLDTREKLIAESLQQHNCVNMYARKIISGNTYIYRVLNPERATLAITRGPDNFWRRSEIFLAKNKSVSWSTKAAVDRWLSRYSLSV